jgi:hypothetical protein
LGPYNYSSFLGSTAQLRPWPPPQNPAEFLAGFSTIFSQGRNVSPTPNPHPGGPGLCIYIPQRQVGYPLSKMWINSDNYDTLTGYRLILRLFTNSVSTVKIRA